MYQDEYRRLILAVAFIAVIITSCVPENQKMKYESVGQAGLMGYWKLDEGSGAVAKDCSGQGRHGEILNGEWVRGSFGYALHFNGENTQVVLPEIPELKDSSELTVEAWVFWEGVGRYPNVLTGGVWNPGGFMIFVHDTQCTFRMGKPGTVRWEVGKNWEETMAGLIRPIKLGRWYHLAASFKRPTITTYVDGELTGSATWNYPVGGYGKIRIGTWDEPGLGDTMYHYGMVAEVKIFKRALSANEIRTEFQKANVIRKGVQP